MNVPLDPSERDDAALTVCVINYQGADCIAGTLEALRGVTAPLREILIVDNGSKDGGPELVERDFPECRLVRLPENVGPAGARNVGFREARTELILFVDNDVALAPQTPARLCATTPRRSWRCPGSCTRMIRRPSSTMEPPPTSSGSCGRRTRTGPPAPRPRRPGGSSHSSRPAF